MEFSAEAVIWTCEATSNIRAYVVESLDRTASRFELKRYSAAKFKHYQEAVVIQIHPASSTQTLVGTGTLKSGAVVQVTAFAEGGVGFRVEDDRGEVVGRCTRNITIN